MAEQLILFEDKLTLLNLGMLALTRLDLAEAETAFERYKGLYGREEDVRDELRLAAFLKKGFAENVGCPGEPAYMCRLWRSFEDYVQSIGYEGRDTVAEIRSVFFRRVRDAVERCGLTQEPLLADDIPTGYVYIQTGQYAEAVKALQGCILRKPNSAAVYGYLGDAYMMRGEARPARRCYQEAFLIDPQAIDWRHVKDSDLVQLRQRLVEDLHQDPGSCVEWLPSYAYLRGFFEPRVMRLDAGLAGFLDEFLSLRKAFLKAPGPTLKAKLFFRGAILCDNDPVLKFAKKISFIEIRRLMKEANPGLFAEYLSYLESRK